MRFSRINGGVLHWRDSGPADAPAVAFCNSLGSDFRIWDEVAALLPGHRVVRYDLRGHGLSDVAVGPFDMDDHVEDLVGLLDHLRIESCAVVGLSVGGMIAQGFAVRHPARLRAIVLCDTAVRIGTRETWTARIAAVEQDGLDAIAEAVLERWFSKRFRVERQDALAGWRNMLTRTPARGYVATCEAIRDTDLGPDAGAIGAPCLCVVGDEDGSTPPDLVRETAAMIPGATFEIIENAGHLPCIDQPDALAALIRRHLAGVGHV